MLERENYSHDIEPEYENFLAIQLVDIPHERSGNWSLTVDENFTIWVTGKPHGHSFIVDKYGVDGSMVLTEGYINFDDLGNVRRIQFKDSHIGDRFKNSPEKLYKFQDAVRNVIKKELQKPQ